MSGQASDIAAKKLQLLDDLIPGKKPVAVLGNPDTPYTALALRQAKTAATTIGAAARDPRSKNGRSDLAGHRPGDRRRAASMLLLEDPVLLSAIPQTVELAAKSHLPAMYGPREYAQAGGLISYGTDQGQMSRRAADICRQDSQGRVPREPPVEQPTKFQLVINLQTAKALGLGDSVQSVVACR